MPHVLPSNLTRLPFHELNCIPEKQIPGCQSTSESTRREKMTALWFLPGSLEKGGQV